MPPKCLSFFYFNSPGPSECEGPWPVSFTYTDNGRRTRTTWARGAWREHAYNDRNLLSSTTYSGSVTPSVAYTYADSGKVASATLSDGTAYAYAYDDRLLATNETVAIGQDDYVLERTYDGFRRPLETAVVVTNARHAAKTRFHDSENRIVGYVLTNAAGRSVSVLFAYDGSYLTNSLYTLPNGGHLNVCLTRNPSRKELVTRRETTFGGQPTFWYMAEYDLLGRPTNATDSVSLAREWQYNSRSELAEATVGTNAYGYAYDTIGNREWAALNGATNTYAANSLNQYTTMPRPSGPPRSPLYDADGNLVNDRTLSYVYDAENRLVSATPATLANGAVRVLNAYDHRHRHIRKTVQSVAVSIPPAPSPPSTSTTPTAASPRKAAPLPPSSPSASAPNPSTVEPASSPTSAASTSQPSDGGFIATRLRREGAKTCMPLSRTILFYSLIRSVFSCHILETLAILSPCLTMKTHLRTDPTIPMPAMASAIEKGE